MFKVYEENSLWYVRNCITEEVIYCANTKKEAMKIAYEKGVESGTIKVGRMNIAKMIQVMNHMITDLHKEEDPFTQEIKNIVINLVNTTDLYELDGINLFKEFLLTGVLDTPKYMDHSKKTKMGGCLA